MAKRVSLFKLLRRQLGDVLAAEGYAEVPQDASARVDMLVYARKASRKPRLGFWFQRNVKSSSVDANGSSFNLEFFRSLAKRFDLDQRERAYFLTASEREKMRVLQNRRECERRAAIDRRGDRLERPFSVGRTVAVEVELERLELPDVVSTPLRIDS